MTNMAFGLNKFYSQLVPFLWAGLAKYLCSIQCSPPRDMNFSILWHAVETKDTST